MKDYESFPPLKVVKARGPYIEFEGGHKVIDAISSWWCKSLGHNHPRLKAALIAQSERFEHVIFANTTYDIILALSEKLVGLTATLKKVFYASEGSSAVEIALKMSLHAQKIIGENKRTQFAALKNGFHGETFMALAVSDLEIYRQPYETQLPQTIFLQNIPYVTSTDDPLWYDCSALWPTIESQLNQHAKFLSAIILEPLVQGAGGMLIYSKDFLQRLRSWTQQNHIHLIADEIMTGLGRTGYALACEHADIEPDFLCLSKGLTSGWLPMSAVLTTDKIYHLFYDDYAKGKSFLHSHTFSGNALAAAVALETLKVMEEENIYQHVRNQQSYLKQLMLEVAAQTQKIHNIRHIGALVAADLILDESQKKQRYGYEVFKNAVPLGAWLRPLGNTIYWLPPLNCELNVLETLRDITIKAIQKTLPSSTQFCYTQANQIDNHA